MATTFYLIGVPGASYWVLAPAGLAPVDGPADGPLVFPDMPSPLDAAVIVLTRPVVSAADPASSGPASVLAAGAVLPTDGRSYTVNGVTGAVAVTDSPPPPPPPPPPPQPKSGGLGMVAALGVAALVAAALGKRGR